jgi:hypothetical protein
VAKKVVGGASRREGEVAVEQRGIELRAGRIAEFQVLSRGFRGRGTVELLKNLESNAEYLGNGEEGTQTRSGYAHTTGKEMARRG